MIEGLIIFIALLLAVIIKLVMVTIKLSDGILAQDEFIKTLIQDDPDPEDVALIKKLFRSSYE